LLQGKIQLTISVWYLRISINFLYASKMISKIHLGILWKRYFKIIVPFMVWYLSLFPGRLSGDTSQAIELLRNGESTDWWTGIYFQFLRISTLNGRFLFLASAITLATLFASVIFFVNSMPISVKHKPNILLLVLLSPLTGAFGVNVSHDVFQASSILIVTGIEFRIIERNFFRNKSDFVIEGLLVLTVFMTHFGLILAVYHVLQILRVKKLSFASIVALSLVLTYFVGGIQVDKSGIKSFAYPMVTDLKCIVQHPDATVNQEDWKALSKLAPIEEWKEKVICRDHVNLLGALPSLDLSEVDSSTLAALYFRLGSQNPYLLVYQHLIRASVVLPPPFFRAPDNQIAYNREEWIGFDSNSELQNGPELLHTSIDISDFKTNLVFIKPFEYLALFPVFIVNQASWFWSWAGLWLYPIAAVLALLRKRSGNSYWMIMTPTLLLSSFLLVFSPQSSGRYVMGTIIIGLTCSVYLILYSAARLFNSKPIAP
jgi:hypothetical protein